MDVSVYLKSVIEADEQTVVICDLDDTVIYMNKAAIERYDGRGGAELVGKNLLNCHNERSRAIIKDIVNRFLADDTLNRVFTFHSIKHGDNDVYMIALRDENGKLIGYYEKHESRIHEQKG